MSPTGYTAAIKDNINFKDFILHCSRAFGALVTMRDDPMDAEIPDVFKPDKYHFEKLAKAEKAYAEAREMTLEEAATASQHEYKAELERRQESMKADMELKEKYLSMLSKVEAWQPPTPEHQGLKDFMIKQINESIDFDCGHEDFYRRNPIRLQMAEEWLSNHINSCLRDIAYHQGQFLQEIKRCEERTAWVQALKKSLGIPINGIEV